MAKTPEQKAVAKERRAGDRAAIKAAITQAAAIYWAEPSDTSKYEAAAIALEAAAARLRARTVKEES